MLETLELEPLKNKKLKLILLESEFPVEWSLFPEDGNALDHFSNVRFISKPYLKVVEQFLQEKPPNFAVEEKGNRTLEEFLYDNPLTQLFKKYEVQYKMVDISPNALDYIASTIEPKRNLLKDIKKEMENYLKKNVKTKDQYIDELFGWSSYLEEEYKESERQIKLEVREAWMVMGILKLARQLEEKNQKILFICNKEHFEGIGKLAGELGIDIELINIKKVPNFEERGSLKESIESSILDIMPVKVKKKPVQEKILYMLDTDNYASPFDINMGYDAGFDAVIPYSNVTQDNVTKLIQDAIFSRAPNSPTTFFIGGSNVKEAEVIAKKVQKSLFPPFEAPVIIDPRGSHSTAAALVAKTMEMASNQGIDDLKDKKVAVLGTGPVGRIATIIAAKLNCKTTLVETWDGASEEFVKNLAAQLQEEAGEGATPVKGEFANTDDKKEIILKEADIIWAVAAAGIQIVSNELLKKLPQNKLVLDINAVPPFGIEGLKPTHDNKEISPGIHGTGALAVGRVKYTTESMILKEAAKTTGKKTFNYNRAFEIAKGLLFKKKVPVPQKLKQ
ncbi:MAG: hypothetical protein EAX96_12850 [Candidatus Lokiarchaeota archaeon]|nr:hypothetical protein [Candidatus Lokiarchaeota archaeon]